MPLYGTPNINRGAERVDYYFKKRKLPGLNLSGSERCVRFSRAAIVRNNVYSKNASSLLVDVAFHNCGYW